VKMWKGRGRRQATFVFFNFLSKTRRMPVYCMAGTEKLRFGTPRSVCGRPFAPLSGCVRRMRGRRPFRRNGV